MIKELHRIAEANFGATPVYTLCTCGEVVEDRSPEALASSFQDHRVAMGMERRTMSSGTHSDGAVRRLSIR